MPDLTELDRLIEEGLTKYGQGDLDAALLSWEKALVIDPENAQASSYVDYVRSNYAMLTSDSADTAAAPFGIADDEPEYHIEISPNDIKPAGAPMYMDPTDESWFMDEEPQRAVARRGPPIRNSESDETLDRSIEDEPVARTVEMEADEPPPPEPPEAPDIPDGVSFEDATREYQPSRAKELQAAMRQMDKEEATAEFTNEVGTGSFSQASHITDIKKRDMGFVKPVEPPPDVDDLPVPPAGIIRPRATSKQPPELKMTLRTPVVDPSAADEADDLALAHEPPAEEDSIGSLPIPKPSSTTLDMPAPILRPATGQPGPAVRAFLDELDAAEPDLPPEVSVSFHTAPTREHNFGLSSSPNDYSSPLLSETRTRETNTRDFSEKPTQEIYNKPPPEPDPLVSAPTRELGLRQVPAPRANTEDEPTGAKEPLDLSRVAVETAEGTRSDVVLPFDPIDARTHEILSAVDDGAPTSEAKDDQTRRRITTLLERAVEWNKAGDIDRAIAAVDLALSEDPNSALAQKLTHRNRDAIMTVFQSFLGDLNRQPMLARPLHELATAPISPRAAFLLSRIDGLLSLDEILDVSGMPRLEAYRHLCQLYLRGILR